MVEKLDMEWLRKNHRIFRKMEEEKFAVKKSEAEYKEFRAKNTVDKRENTTL